MHYLITRSAYSYRTAAYYAIITKAFDGAVFSYAVTVRCGAVRFNCTAAHRTIFCL